MQAHNPVRVDQDVSAELAQVVGGTAQLAAAPQQLDVAPPGRRTKNGPPSAPVHAVGVIEFLRFVPQDGPGKRRFAGIVLGDGGTLERDDDNGDVQRFQFAGVLLQLQQVFAAGESGQVPVEDHQQPAAGVIVEPVRPADGVVQIKVDGRFAGPAVRFTDHRKSLVEVPATR